MSFDRDLFDSDPERAIADLIASLPENKGDWTRDDLLSMHAAAEAFADAFDTLKRATQAFGVLDGPPAALDRASAALKEYAARAERLEEGER